MPCVTDLGHCAVLMYAVASGVAVASDVASGAAMPAGDFAEFDGLSLLQVRADMLSANAEVEEVQAKSGETHVGKMCKPGGVYYKNYLGGFTGALCAAHCKAMPDCKSFSHVNDMDSTHGYCIGCSGEKLISNSYYTTMETGDMEEETEAEPAAKETYEGKMCKPGGAYYKNYLGGFTGSACAAHCDAISDCKSYSHYNDMDTTSGYCIGCSGESLISNSHYTTVQIE